MRVSKLSAHSEARKMEEAMHYTLAAILAILLGFSLPAAAEAGDHRGGWKQGHGHNKHRGYVADHRKYFGGHGRHHNKRYYAPPRRVVYVQPRHYHPYYYQPRHYYSQPSYSTGSISFSW